MPTLIQSLCERPPRAARHAAPIFFHSKPRCCNDCDWRAPLQFDDGRIYDVLDFCARENQHGGGAEGEEVLRICEVELLRRGGDWAHLFFCWYFFASGFERGEFDDSPHFFVSYTRQWAWNYLNNNHQSLPLSRWAKPIIAECR